MNENVNRIIYEIAAWMQELEDADGARYLMLGRVTSGPKNTLAVTPKNGTGETKFFCVSHRRVYRPNDTCADCRNAPVPETV
jgi:hypothetical protein